MTQERDIDNMELGTRDPISDIPDDQQRLREKAEALGFSEEQIKQLLKDYDLEND